MYLPVFGSIPNMAVPTPYNEFPSQLMNGGSGKLEFSYHCHAPITNRTTSYPTTNMVTPAYSLYMPSTYIFGMPRLMDEAGNNNCFSNLISDDNKVTRVVDYNF